MKSLTKIITLAVLVVFAGASMVNGYESKVVLLGEAEVRTDAIYLSDLLPSQTPSPMREIAAQILIGMAPQPGSTRVLEGLKITNLLAGDDAFRTIEVPHQIVVRRGGRSITRDEVVAAIRAALVNNGFSSDQVQPEDVTYSSAAMFSGMADPRLGVMRMDFDSGLQQVRFLLKSHANPSALPFFATARLRGSVPTTVTSREIEAGQILKDSDQRKENRTANSTQGISNVKLEQIVGKRAAAPVGSGVALRPADFDSVPMVQPGRMASLSATSRGTQMLLDVVPLERGVMGQTIRVKLPGTGKVLRANVVGAGRLEAIF